MMTIERIKLDSQGYTKHGQYYGTGDPLWRIEADLEEETIAIVLRAKDRKEAKTLADPIIKRKEKDREYARWARENDRYC